MANAAQNGIKELVRSLPHTPGVYFMKDALGDVIYVGKARDLKKRVSSYFKPGSDLTARIALMVSRVAGLEYVKTSTEAEALIYENSFIKRYHPRYNVALKDSKTYPFLKLTVNERFPRLLVTRKRADGDGALYYGPYSSPGLMRGVFETIRRIFPVRKCARMGPKRCLYFHLGQCLGPCEEGCDEAKYRQAVDELKLYLDGRRQELVALIVKKMQDAAARRDYEEATLLRDRANAIASLKGTTIAYGPLGELAELKERAELPAPPVTIEAFDVSNVMGTEAVGSMISFYKGKPKKSAYKRFKIKTVGAIDDYAMMREIVRRRYGRIIAEGGTLPDLVLIDGGKGHLEAASSELRVLGLTVPVVALAKELELLFVKGRAKPLVLPRDSKALHLLQRIRDEAHRFAIGYHRLLRRKRVSASALDGIRGIGSKRKRALLAAFGSIGRIANAPLESLASVRGMNESAAGAVIGHFKKNKP